MTTAKPSILSRLNPLREVDNKKEVFAWSMYDLANQSFTLLIVTLLFPTYLREVIVADNARGDHIWSILGSVSLVLVVISSPLVGALADARGTKKRLLVATGIACGLLTCALTFTGPSNITTAALIFVAANICFLLGENLLAAFLPEIASSRNIGRVSAFGWTMGYVGALALLTILAIISALATPTTADTRWFFLLAGLWFLAGLIPPARVLRETPPVRLNKENALAAAISRITTTVKEASKYRQLLRFLTAFFVFAMGVQTVVYFAGILLDDFGFNQTKKFIFMLQVTITAGIGAIASGWIQPRAGARNTVYVYLAIWVITCLALVFLAATPTDQRPEWLFWIVGNGFGIGLGGIGSASRAAVGRFTPTHKTAEFFGLWGMTYKLAGAVGLILYGQTKAQLGGVPALILLTTFFAVGALLLARVNERSGLVACARNNRNPS